MASEVVSASDAIQTLMYGTRYIGLSALIVSMSLCHAQGFNIAHHNQNMLGASGRSIFEQADGYLMFSVQWSLNTTHSELFITKFNEVGEFISEQSYPTDRNTDPGIMDPVARRATGGYAVTVSLFGGNDPNVTRLLLFDPNGELVFDHFVKTDTIGFGNHGTRQLIELSDGHFLHSGWCSVPVNTPCITKIDSTGEIIWEHGYEIPYASYIFSATPTTDGGFVLGSKINSYPDQGVIIKVDSLGEQIWLRRFGGMSITGGSRVEELTDGSFLSIGAWESLNSPPLSEMQYGSLYRFTSSGSQIWRKDYFYGWKAGMAHIRRASEDLYWLVGAGYNEDYTQVHHI